jgi:hypothetical protein
MFRMRWLAALCVVPLFGCETQHARGDADAGTGALGGSSAGGNGGLDASGISQGGHPSATGGHGGAVHVEAPVVHCGPMDGGGGAAGASSHDDSCAPPPSLCGNSVTLVYYTDGACIDGRCTWTQEQQICDYGCDANGCTFPFTLR